MAEKIQKVTVPKKDLPPISGVYGGYLVRYRIVSEDKNRDSHWSPFYNLATANAPKFTLADGTKSESIFVKSVDSTANTLTVVWTPPANFGVTGYDIYTKADSGPWQYKLTTTGTSYSVTGNDGVVMNVAVQVPTYPKERFENATLFTTSATL